VIDLRSLAWVGLSLCLLLDGLAIAARTGLSNVNLARLLAQRERMDRRVNYALTLIHADQNFRSALLLLQTVLRFAMAGLVLTLATPSAAWGVLILSAILLFSFEWLVQSYALRNTELWALRLAPSVRLLTVVLTPLLLLPLALSHNPRGEYATNAVTEDDLKNLVDAGQEEGLLEQEERKMIYSIFELGNRLAREIMAPRIDILALDVNTSLPQAVEAMVRFGHSRVPVYDETIDHVLGLLYARDLLEVQYRDAPPETLRALLRPAYFIPEAKEVDELLAEMQSQRIHMAIVVDEYGGVAGLVTLEDIVEEIVGEIQDEYDQAEESPYQTVKDGEYIFQGRVDIDDFNEVMGSHLSREGADTLGGMIYSQMGRVPSVGDKVQVEGLLLTVEQVSGRRIRKIRARWSPVLEQSQEEDHVDG
jgi:CBS domain containing-hemolysin-like protein